MLSLLSSTLEDVRDGSAACFYTFFDSADDLFHSGGSVQQLASLLVSTTILPDFGYELNRLIGTSWLIDWYSRIASILRSSRSFRDWLQSDSFCCIDIYWLRRASRSSTSRYLHRISPSSFERRAWSSRLALASCS